MGGRRANSDPGLTSVSFHHHIAGRAGARAPAAFSTIAGLTEAFARSFRGGRAGCGLASPAGSEPKTMNGDADTDFTALDQYQTERHEAPASVVPSASSEPFFEPALQPAPEIASRTRPPSAAATRVEPFPVERRRRSRIGRVSLQLAAVVLLVQAGGILLTIAARQTRSEPSSAAAEPITSAPDDGTNHQVLTARADDRASLRDRRDLRLDPKPVDRPANRGSDTAGKAPKGPRSTDPAVQAPETPRTTDELPPEPATEQATVSSPAESAAPSPIPAESAAPQQPVVRSAELLTYVRPTYPDVAKQSGVTGGVEVDMTIDTLGRVVRSYAVSGPRLLRGASESALRQWRFRPASVDGTPVSSRRRYLVSFSSPSSDEADVSVSASEPHDP